jgi:hypothetical protein
MVLLFYSSETSLELKEEYLVFLLFSKGLDESPHFNLEGVSVTFVYPLNEAYKPDSMMKMINSLGEVLSLF